MQIYIYAYIHYNHIYTCVYIYIYGLVFRVPTPPMVWVPGWHPLPFYLQAIGSISEVQPRIC